jgi:mRNA-degrading endonuclease toxin of MazEF toxin-antitoxin module
MPRPSARNRSLRRGEIWWAAPQLSGGTRKRRPLLIVSHDSFNKNERYPKVMVVHLTSVHRPGDPFDWEVNLPRGAGGLRQASVAKCGEVYTLRKEQLESLVGTVPAEAMARIDRALALALDLPPARQS